MKWLQGSIAGIMACTVAFTILSEVAMDLGLRGLLGPIIQIWSDLLLQFRNLIAAHISLHVGPEWLDLYIQTYPFLVLIYLLFIKNVIDWFRPANVRSELIKGPISFLLFLSSPIFIFAVYFRDDIYSFYKLSYISSFLGDYDSGGVFGVIGFLVSFGIISGLALFGVICATVWGASKPEDDEKPILLMATLAPPIAVVPSWLLLGLMSLGPHGITQQDLYNFTSGGLYFLCLIAVMGNIRSDVTFLPKALATTIALASFDFVSAHFQIGVSELPAIVDARSAPARAPLVADPSGLPDFSLFRDCELCPEMVVLPAGHFMMGSPVGERGRDEDEDDTVGAGGKQVEVSIDRFAMSRFEVTWSEWEACVAAGACVQEPIDEVIAEDRRAARAIAWGRARRPVILVNWHDARAYADFVSGHSSAVYRLPTEAEWEYAARAGTTSPFSSGERPPGCPRRVQSLCNNVRPVWRGISNPWGLYDMQGNVGEWVMDCYTERLFEQETPRQDAPSCHRRVTRGNAWGDSLENRRSAARSWDHPLSRSASTGFRLVRSL